MGFVGAIAIALAMSGRGGDVAGPHIYYDEPIAPTLERGAEGVWVETLNERLLELGFHPDIGDEFGNKTRHAVFAFQKHHEMPTTGKFTPGMWHLLDEHVSLPWRPESARVEIDLGKQVLYVVESSEVTRVAPISSGNGEKFTSSRGTEVRAFTPEGQFTFQRHIPGIRVSYLGSLYNPYYFRGGYAVHGSSSVPNQPASHGCVRVTN